MEWQSQTQTKGRKDGGVIGGQGDTKPGGKWNSSTDAQPGPSG